VVLAPLLAFVVPLARAKRAGLHAYGHLSKRYIDEFETRWVRGGSAAGEPMLGSADIQSLADMANGYEVVKEMRVVPLSREMLVQLAILALLPLAPLLLTMISIEELLGHLVKIVL
jgi:hypothetical protein